MPTVPTRASRPKPTEQVTELRELVVGYAKQETIEPLKHLKRFLAYGISGAVCVGIGVSFLLLGLLRGLQQIDFFNGRTQRDGWHGSWLIYVITLFAGAVVLAIALLAARRPVPRKHTGPTSTQGTTS